MGILSLSLHSTFNHASISRSHWPRSLRLGSAAARVLGFTVSNPTGGMVIRLLGMLCVVR